jgi:spermidine synthase
MFAHPNPKHIGIVGGAEGSTLREVLKHKTVESATVIEIDEELLVLMKEFMPTLSNCSDLIGRAESCFDDEVAEIVIEDGKKLKWLRSCFFVPPAGYSPSFLPRT